MIPSSCVADDGCEISETLGLCAVASGINVYQSAAVINSMIYSLIHSFLSIGVKVQEMK